MANDVTIDTSQMIRFAVDLGHVAASAVSDLDPVVKRGAENIKNDMVTDADASKHFSGKRRGGGIGRTITYDRDYGIGYVGYEVGPDRDRGGMAPLAGVAYLGGANGGGGTLDLDGPLEREAPRLMKALLDRLGTL